MLPLPQVSSQEHPAASVQPAETPAGVGDMMPLPQVRRSTGTATTTTTYLHNRSVLRIHAILVRIRIRGSMPLTNGSGSRIRILLFSSLTFEMPTKK
jgi:hypothetical protein